MSLTEATLYAMGIDHDPEGQAIAIRKIVTLLHATDPLGRSERVVGNARQHVLEAIGSYRAAVVELVLEGSLNVDQGAELDAIVDRIIREHQTGSGPTWPSR